MTDDFRYLFKVITRSETRSAMGMGWVVTVSLLVGEGDKMSLSGTLSMTQEEWEPLAEALRTSLGDAVTFEHLTRGKEPRS